MLDRARTLGHAASERMGQAIDQAGAAPRSRFVVAAGLVAVLLIAAVAAFLAWPDGDNPQAQPPPPATTAEPTTTADTPLIPDVQEYRDRGIALNVPAGWEQSGNGSYVDYTDPASARKVRINIEAAGSTAERFLEVAENGLNTRPASCAVPYQRIGLVEAQLAGQAGAELEYTCGDGEDKRHGLWRAVVRDGKAYHFYLTTPEAQFTESRVIYDELVRSFHFV
jgi:hypothetical protein